MSSDTQQENPPEQSPSDKEQSALNTVKEEMIPQWMLDAAKVGVDRLMELGGWYHFLKGHPDATQLYALVIKGVAKEFHSRIPAAPPSPPPQSPQDPTKS